MASPVNSYTTYVDELAYCLRKTGFDPRPNLTNAFDRFRAPMQHHSPTTTYEDSWLREYQLRFKEAEEYLAGMEAIMATALNPKEKPNLVKSLENGELRELYRLLHFPEMIAGKPGAKPSIAHTTPQGALYQSHRSGSVQSQYRFNAKNITMNQNTRYTGDNEFHIDRDIGLIGDMKLWEQYFKMPAYDYSTLERQMADFKKELDRSIRPLYEKRFSNCLVALHSICGDASGLGMPPQADATNPYHARFIFDLPPLANSVLSVKFPAFYRWNAELTEDYNRLHPAIKAAWTESMLTQGGWEKRDALIYTLFDHPQEHVLKRMLSNVQNMYRALHQTTGTVTLDAVDQIKYNHCMAKCRVVGDSIKAIIDNQLSPSLAKQQRIFP